MCMHIKFGYMYILEKIQQLRVLTTLRVVSNENDNQQNLQILAA